MMPVAYIANVVLSIAARILYIERGRRTDERVLRARHIRRLILYPNIRRRMNLQNSMSVAGTLYSDTYRLALNLYRSRYWYSCKTLLYFIRNKWSALCDDKHESRYKCVRLFRDNICHVHTCYGNATSL